MRRAAGLALLAALAGAGCAGVLGGGEAAGGTTGAHVLFLVRPDCRTVVARTLTSGAGRAFTVLTLEDDTYRPLVGDVLEGPARAGRSVFVFYPSEALATRAGGRPMPADVLAVGLEPGEARGRYDAACGPPTPPGTAPSDGREG